MEWYDRIQRAAEPSKQFDQLFAFYHCVWSIEKGGDDVLLRLANQRDCFDKTMFEKEVGFSERYPKCGRLYRFLFLDESFTISRSFLEDI